MQYLQYSLLLGLIALARRAKPSPNPNHPRRHMPPTRTFARSRRRLLRLPHLLHLRHSRLLHAPGAHRVNSTHSVPHTFRGGGALDAVYCVAPPSAATDLAAAAAANAANATAATWGVQVVAP